MTTEYVTSEAQLTKFQDLLRELFQLDCVNLDFGNGGWVIPGAKAMEPVFKERMFAGVRT